MASGLKAKLAALGKKWGAEAKRAKTEGPGSNVPDADYVARLMKAAVEDSAKGLRFTLNFTIVEEGDYEGETLRKSDGLEGDDSLYYLGRTLVNLGYDPEEIEIENLEAIAKELTKEKPVCNVRTVTKDGSTYQNVYVNGLAEDWDGGDEEDDSEDGEIEEGSPVAFTFRGEELTGTVEEFTEDGAKAKVKRDDTGKTVTIKVENLELLASDEDEEDGDEEDDSEDEDTEDVEAAEGMRVSFEWKGEEDEGEITEVCDDEIHAKVKRDSNGKVIKIKLESLELLDTDETDEDEEEDGEDEDEEEEEVKPAPKGRGKAAPASTSKPKTSAPAASSKTTSKPAAKAPAASAKKPAASKPATSKPAGRSRK